MSITEIKTNGDRSNAEVIDLLEDIIERAEAGEVLSIGICAVMTKGNIGEFVAGGSDTAALLGASMLMQDRIKRRFDDE